MIYVVTFEVKQTTQINRLVYHCKASNAKEAVRLAKEQWAVVFNVSNKIPRQLHLHAVRSSVQNPDMLRVVSWRGDVFNGPSCFDFLCTGYDWRC